MACHLSIADQALATRLLRSDYKQRLTLARTSGSIRLIVQAHAVDQCSASLGRSDAAKERCDACTLSSGLLDWTASCRSSCLARQHSRMMSTSRFGTSSDLPASRRHAIATICTAADQELLLLVPMPVACVYICTACACCARDCPCCARECLQCTSRSPGRLQKGAPGDHYASWSSAQRICA